MKIIQFLRETKGEMGQVNWPSRRKAIFYALIIIIFSVAVGYSLGGFDLIFREILKTVIIK